MLEMSKIASDFKHGIKFSIGGFCIIQEKCKVGYNVNIQHFVLLKKGTIIGNHCYIDSYVRSSGQNRIGNNVTIRFGATIGREVTIEDDVFISPNVGTMFKNHLGGQKGGIVIGKGSFIGTNAIIGAGVKIAPGSVIGAMALVTKDIVQKGTYIGIPAKRID